MSRYGAFNLNQNYTQPTLNSKKMTGSNLDESFKVSLNDSAVLGLGNNTIGSSPINSKPF